MNTNIIIAAIVGILVIGGGAFFLTMGDDDDANNDSSNTSSNEQSNGNASDIISDANPLGIDINASVEGPYRVTISTTDADGRESSGVIDIDGNGNIQSTITDQGQEVSFISVDGDTYVIAPGEDTYTKFPSGDSSNPIDTSELETGLTQDDLDEISGLDIVDKGTGSCTAGTCRIYETTDPESGEVTEVKVDQATNRLSDVTILNSPTGEELMMSYDFNADINIEAPAEFEEFEIPEIEGVDVDALLEQAGAQ